MDTWKQTFLGKLNKAQAEWMRAFEEALDEHFVPVYDEYREFLGHNGFTMSTPLREAGRRSYKFELGENAYVLMVFRARGVGELELSWEGFAPGCDPVQHRVVTRVADVDESWGRQQLQQALDEFVGLLNGGVTLRAEELSTV